MAMLIHDLRHGARVFRKNPRFIFVAVLTLALGIGATTVVFSATYNLLIASFPYSHFDRIVTFTVHDLAAHSSGRQYFPIPHFKLIREQNRVFEDLLGFYECDVRYRDGQGTRQFAGACGTSNSLQFFGVSALVGMVFTPDDVTANAPAVFVMNYRLWRTEFNSDPNIIGRTFHLNDRLRTLIGIMPPRFEPFGGASIYLPLSFSQGAEGASFFGRPASLRVIGRLKPGITVKTAAADLNVLIHSIVAMDSRYPARFTVVVERLRDVLTGPLKTTLSALIVGVILLLLIACSNVANLLLMRATAREREMAIRASLGASPGRLLRQLLVESLLLAVVAALAGCIAAYVGLRGLAVILPHGAIPGEVVIGFQPLVVMFAVAVATITTILCGVAPAWHAAHGNLNDRLAGSSKGVGQSSRHGNLRAALVVAEVAISIVLLVGAGLMLRTVFALMRVDLGVYARNILYVQLATPVGRYDRGDQKALLIRPVLERVQSLPGVIAATESTSWPPDSLGEGTPVAIAGKTGGNALTEMVSEGYFDTLGLRLLQGRLLAEHEVDNAKHLAVVNASFARQFFSGRNPDGQIISLAGFDRMPYQSPDAVHSADFEIIGVVTDYRNVGLRRAPAPQVFIPYTITGVVLNRTIMVRSAADPSPLLKPIVRALWAVDPDVGFSRSGTVESYVNDLYYRDPHFEMRVLGIFAGIGLALVAIAIFSVMAYTVSLQTHDIGVRMALGADPAAIVQMVLRRGFGLIGTGILLGAAMSAMLTKLLSSQLWGVSTHDPQTFVMAVIAIVVVGLVASLIPANRAARVDPIEALRQE
jgi:putative ABC transport system permease protein